MTNNNIDQNNNIQNDTQDKVRKKLVFKKAIIPTLTTLNINSSDINSDINIDNKANAIDKNIGFSLKSSGSNLSNIDSNLQNMNNNLTSEQNISKEQNLKNLDQINNNLNLIQKVNKLKINKDAISSQNNSASLLFNKTKLNESQNISKNYFNNSKITNNISSNNLNFSDNVRNINKNLSLDKSKKNHQTSSLDALERFNSIFLNTSEITKQTDVIKQTNVKNDLSSNLSLTSEPNEIHSANNHENIDANVSKNTNRNDIKNFNISESNISNNLTQSQAKYTSHGYPIDQLFDLNRFKKVSDINNIKNHEDVNTNSNNIQSQIHTKTLLSKKVIDNNLSSNINQNKTINKLSTNKDIKNQASHANQIDTNAKLEALMQNNKLTNLSDIRSDLKFNLNINSDNNSNNNLNLSTNNIKIQDTVNLNDKLPNKQTESKVNIAQNVTQLNNNQINRSNNNFSSKVNRLNTDNLKYKDFFNTNNTNKNINLSQVNTFNLNKNILEVNSNKKVSNNALDLTSKISAKEAKLSLLSNSNIFLKTAINEQVIKNNKEDNTEDLKSDHQLHEKLNNKLNLHNNLNLQKNNLLSQAQNIYSQNQNQDKNGYQDQGLRQDRNKYGINNRFGSQGYQNDTNNYANNANNYANNRNFLGHNQNYNKTSNNNLNNNVNTRPDNNYNKFKNLNNFTTKNQDYDANHTTNNSNYRNYSNNLRFNSNNSNAHNQENNLNYKNNHNLQNKTLNSNDSQRNYNNFNTNQVRDNTEHRNFNQRADFNQRGERGDFNQRGERGDFNQNRNFTQNRIFNQDSNYTGQRSYNNTNFIQRNYNGANQNNERNFNFNRGTTGQNNFQNRNQSAMGQNNFQNRNQSAVGQNNFQNRNQSTMGQNNFQNRNQFPGGANYRNNNANNFTNFNNRNNQFIKPATPENKSTYASDYGFLDFESQNNKNNENRNKNKSKNKYSEDVYIKTKRGIQKRISLYDSESNDVVSRAGKRRGKKSSYAASHQAMKLEIPTEIAISELSKLLNQQTKNLISEFKKFGFEYAKDSVLDFESAKLALEAMGHEVTLCEDKNIDNLILSDSLTQNNLDKSNVEYVKKPPVVVVMGHVDHGKTSLLDALRNSKITEKEHGSITQHIGAYSIDYKDEIITFLDTPGHEAFTKIRSRGSSIANIAILVVAADDGIKTQTIEAINHIKAAKIPLIVAVNKIDKTDKYENILNGLLQYDIIPESMGGDAIVVFISALKKINLDKLCDSILLLSEMLDLKYPKDSKTSGTIIESRIDKFTGIAATIIPQTGKVNVGDIIVAGTSYGKVRNLVNDKGEKIKSASVSMPIEIFGMSTVPIIGSTFLVVQTEKEAKELIANYEQKLKLSSSQIDTDLVLRKLENSNIKTLNIIIKGDVLSSIDAIESSVLAVANEDLDIVIVHKGIGLVTDNDIMLAASTSSIIIAFNMKITNSVSINATKEKVKILNYYLIYSLLDEVKQIASGMMPLIITENILGSAEVRNIFNLTKEGLILGCYILKGMIKRNLKARVIRNNIVLGNVKIDSIRRFKENVSEVNENFECGISVSGFKNFALNDVLECFEETSKVKSL